jgi:hypothetical protein
MRVQDLRNTEAAYDVSFFHKRGWTKRFDWEARLGKSLCHDVFRFKVTLGGEDERAVRFGFALLGAALYLRFHRALPKFMAIGWFERDGVRNPRWHEDSMGRSWGAYTYSGALVFLWGSCVVGSGKGYGYSKHFNFPWDLGANVRHEVLRTDGTWVKPSSEYDPPYSDGRQVWLEPYNYVLKSGEKQYRIATFFVEEREWRWRCFRWLYKYGIKLGPALIRRCISISFNQEIGERCGSWKGGTTGCGYEMLPGESPLACLRRMEVERKFT